MAYADAVVETKVTVTAVELTLAPQEAITLRRLLHCHVCGPYGPGTLRGDLDSISHALGTAMSGYPELLAASQQCFDNHHAAIRVA